jgi:hypothetical protein
LLRSCWEAGKVLKGFLGQLVGVIAIPLWLGMTVYFMSRAAEPNATDAGNWFAGFVVFTVIFIGLMAFWGRIFRDEHEQGHA